MVGNRTDYGTKCLILSQNHADCHGTLNKTLPKKKFENSPTTKIFAYVNMQEHPLNALSEEMLVSKSIVSWQNWED